MSLSLPAEYLALTQKKNARPMSWDGVVGNEAAVDGMREALAASQTPGHTLIYAPPGMGKTTMAQLFAKDVGGEYFGLTASNLETPADLLRYCIEMNESRKRTGRSATLFIDEIHRLGKATGRAALDEEVLFTLLEDWVVYHNLMGKAIELLNRPDATYTPSKPEFRVWPFTCIGATTDPGELSAALRRRFLNTIELEPYTDDHIVTIVRGMAERLDWPLDPDAAIELARFSRNAPGRARELLENIHNRAMVSSEGRITLQVVREIIARLKLYPLGLLQPDVDVLKLLYQRGSRGAGEAELAKAIGRSRSHFLQMIEPYLRFKGFVETLARRVITPLGVIYLADIDQIDKNDPSARAILAARKA